jgi:hypothetical protein
MKRRVRSVPPPDSPHGSLLECERQAEAAGDHRRLVQVRSWLAMLADAGPDHDVIAELFATYAREGG